MFSFSGGDEGGWNGPSCFSSRRLSCRSSGDRLFGSSGSGTRDAALSGRPYDSRVDAAGPACRHGDHRYGRSVLEEAQPGRVGLLHWKERERRRESDGGKGVAGPEGAARGRCLREPARRTSEKQCTGLRASLEGALPRRLPRAPHGKASSGGGVLRRLRVCQTLPTAEPAVVRLQRVSERFPIPGSAGRHTPRRAARSSPRW